MELPPKFTKQQIIEQLADFENNISNIEQELSDLVYEKSEEKPQPSQPEPSTDMSKLDELLSEIKKKGEQSEKEEMQNMKHISKMIVDIENEFGGLGNLDSLLRKSMTKSIACSERSTV